MENVRKHRYIKLITTNISGKTIQCQNLIITQQRFSKNLLAIEMTKTKVKMNKPIYLGLSILKISKTITYDFWYDYIKPKYQYNSKLWYMGTCSFTFLLKLKMLIRTLQMIFKKRFDTSTYKINKPLPKDKKRINWINER